MTQSVTASPRNDDAEKACATTTSLVASKIRARDGGSRPGIEESEGLIVAVAVAGMADCWPVVETDTDCRPDAVTEGEKDNVGSLDAVITGATTPASANIMNSLSIVVLLLFAVDYRCITDEQLQVCFSSQPEKTKKKPTLARGQRATLSHYQHLLIIVARSSDVVDIEEHPR